MRLGFFDSGIGGRTVEQSLSKRYDFETEYYAASELFPLGNRTQEEILAAAQTGIATLINHDVEHIVIACHTASVYLPENPLCTRICDFVDGYVQDSDDLVICTQATANSGWYQARDYKVIAMPELASLIENNQLRQAKEYITKQLAHLKFGRLLLCSTHYPTIPHKQWHKAVGRVFPIINPADYISLPNNFLDALA
jgi:glutamate racemase